MADETPVTIPAAAPSPAAPAPAPTPAATAPAPSPASAPAAPPAAGVVESAPQAGAEAPVVGEIVAKGPETPETPDSGEKPAEKTLPGDKPTLLEEAVDPAAKKDEKPGETTTEGPQSDLTRPKVHFEPYKFPEGVKADDTVVNAFNNMLIEDGTPQDRGQKLVDLHVSELKKYDASLRDEQQRVFDETRQKWRTELMADPEMGGSGFNTTKLNVAQMRDMFVSLHPPGSEEHIQEMAEFNRMLRYTGVGDHPAFWRLMHNVSRRFKEPASPNLEFKPPPDIGRKPRVGGTRLRDTYTHPTSHTNRTS